MKQMLVVKIDRCLGCKSCEIACAVEHSTSRDLFEAVKELPAPQTRVRVVQGETFAAPLQCRQCEDAPCVAICPTKALHRGAGEPVILDKELCIGCTWCVVACPFGVITLDRRGGAVVKCDQCFARAERGEVPACVEACPSGALEIEELEAVAAGKQQAFLVQIERSLTGSSL